MIDTDDFLCYGSYIPIVLGFIFAPIFGWSFLYSILIIIMGECMVLMLWGTEVYRNIRIMEGIDNEQ